MIDARWNRNRGAHFSDAKLAELYAQPQTLLEVLTREDGPWADVPPIDRLWVFFRAATSEQSARVIEKATARVVTEYALHCGIDEVEEWAASWLSGKDRSEEAAAEASAAAKAAVSWKANAAWAAANAAGRMATHAAWVARATNQAVWVDDAAWAAAWVAERTAVAAAAAGGHAGGLAGSRSERWKQIQNALEILQETT